MSSHISSLLLALLPILPIRVHAANGIGDSCAQYYLDRVAFLLGCCGDLSQDYKPPAFGALTDVERATTALAEIASSKKLKCYKPESTEFRILALNRIGALIMRERALSSRSGKGDLDTALIDADTARKDLQKFVKTNPKDAIAVWTWIALSFRNCGYELDALSFLVALPTHCCQQSEMDVLKGDLYFDLGIYEAAAQFYSRWLGDSSASPVCGRDISLGRAAELRKRGFRIPIPTANSTITCAPQSSSEWEPFITLSR